MKKYLFTIGFMFVLSAAMIAQSIQIKNSEGTDITGTTYTINGTTDESEISEELAIQNNSSNGIHLLVKKRIVSMIDGADNYFCLNACYPPTVYAATNSITIASGGVLEGTEGFSCHYLPGGNVGVSTIVYTFWDEANEADSSQVTVEFNVSSPNSISNLLVEGFSVYPNPASEMVYVDYQLNSVNNAWFTLYNSLGMEVMQVRLEEIKGHHPVNISRLQNGLYFYTLRVDGKDVKSSRLLVQ